MEGPKKYNTRCFHYRDDGSRKSKGFHSNTCRFAHPDDPEWLTASVPVQRYHSPAPKERYSSNSYPRHRDSRSKSPRRRDPESSSSRRRSRSFSRESRDRERTSSHRPPSADPRMDPRRPLPSVRVPSSSPAPPKQPATFAPPPPPPPIIPVPPSLPARFTASDTVPKPAPQEEMKVMWEKVLPLLANCVEAQKAYQDAQSELTKYERLLKTDRYMRLCGDAERARAQQERARLATVRDDMDKVVRNSLHALKDTAWWPVGPNQDDNAAEKYRELLGYALELNKVANGMYQAYVNKLSNAPASASSVTAVHAPPPQSGSDPRPPKRRRVSDAADGAPPLDAADVAEIGKIREHVEKLADQVYDVQNELQELQNQNTEDIVAQIDAKFEAFALDVEDNPSGASAAELQRVDATINKAAQDMSGLGTEIVTQMTTSTALRTQTDELKAEMAQQGAQFAAMQAQLHAFQEASERDRHTIDALTVACDKLMQQPAPSPPSLPLDFILAAIDEPIRDTVQAIVRPMVEDLDRELREKIAKQDAETYGHLWAKIALTLKVVDAVHKVTPAEPAVKSRATSQAAAAQAVP
ncbi:hypothetical protein K438DRAFT_1233013 [Mycena galopus ATCC 62051]|nr:hypothetical protein K438DRAFT_1233013 [Mycena galopus ATCC 62051]